MSWTKYVCAALGPLLATGQLVMDFPSLMKQQAPEVGETRPPGPVQETSIVSDGKLCDANVQQHSGYVKFSGYGGDKSYFFWMFESRSDPKNDPLVIWLTGGPGCSSQMALMSENGPCKVNKGGKDTSNNPHSWTNKANVIWVDQPAGTGFSSGAWDYGEDGVEEDFYNFLQAFYKELPQYKDKPLFMTGESYAGHYVPAISHYIHKMNKDSSNNLPKINLKGMAVGNGLTNTEIQYGWYAKMAEDGGKDLGGSLEKGVITNPMVLDIMKAGYYPCKKAIQMCNAGSSAACGTAFIVCNYAETVPYQLSGYNPYDMRIKCEVPPLCYDFSEVTTYLNNEDTKKAIGAEGSWSSCNMIVNKLFMGDFMKSFHQGIPELLKDGIDVLIYAGDVDYICNWLGNKAWTKALEWEGKDAFNAANDDDYKVDGKAAGRLRTHKNFHFLQVYNAGHMVPMNQPAVADQFLQEFIAGKWTPKEGNLLKSLQSTASEETDDLDDEVVIV